MRYHYVKPSIYLSKYGETYTCDHPVYNVCTLFKIGDKGLAIVQQRINSDTKLTWWSDIYIQGFEHVSTNVLVRMHTGYILW